MNRIWRFLPLLSLLPLATPLVHAQAAIDVGVGFGGAWASANKSGLDTVGNTCSVGTSTCEALPALSNFMLGFGGDVMVKSKIGVGIEYLIQPAKSDYGPLQDRQSFYDFNAVYRPISSKRASLNLEGGIGGARTSFSVTQTQCVGTAVCSSSVSPLGTASHFQTHVGVGLQVFATEHFFIRPQFDIHFVNGFTDQFGRNVVPSATVWVGYTLGSR